MSKYLSKIFGILSLTALLSSWLFVPTLVSAAARDCDSNAVIYCGAYTTSELKNKIEGGTGKQYQSGTELKALFKKYNIYTSDFGKLKNGRVTDTNKVYVGDKQVASNVYSMGRSYMNGSTKISGLSYPLYLRHPSVSFRSSSIDAYVYMNDNGTMRYAIIKSCGNIVPGVMPAPTYKLTLLKFHDQNADKIRQTTEPKLSGWIFDVTGPGSYAKTVTTDATGTVVLTGLKAGTYRATERMKDSWYSTTGITKLFDLKADTVVAFGNALVKREEYVQIQIIKFEDLNRNKVMDTNEQVLPNWTFKVTGPSFSETVVTDANGQSLITGLRPGTYTVTENLEKGWENTTGLTVTRSVTSDARTQVFVFGNKQITKQPKKELPTSGPMETAAAAMASMTLTGGALAYIRSKKELLSAIKNK